MPIFYCQGAEGQPCTAPKACWPASPSPLHARDQLPHGQQELQLPTQDPPQTSRVRVKPSPPSAVVTAMQVAAPAPLSSDTEPAEMSQPQPPSALAVRCLSPLTSHPPPASPSFSYKAVSHLGHTVRHNVIAWEVVISLIEKVAEYGLGSVQVIQALRVLKSDLLGPSDIRYIARVLFQPFLFDIFLNKWRKAAEKAAEGNRLLPQGDPRFHVGADVLLGEQASSNPDFQAWDFAVLEQGQRVGFKALLRTIELASPGPQFTTITQGAYEPFLPFVERLADALERQVENDETRDILCKQLAWLNSNTECQRIIEALPGDPSLVDMVTACARAGPVHHSVSGQMPLEGGQQKRSKNKGKRKQGTPQPTGTGPLFSCARCLRAGHFSKQCKAKFHANGQPLAGPGTGQ
ncbi:pyridine nucleotide-disulfide oxidoreductase domain-containing protein 1 isoform X4 [Passer domesticus]|uniref:pyridine nucleotide-disulfide oxidoreductase domain-containing protein 1 isoform X4 n=1 Tax=Passer domesticus TaxID=48849 RepID=UPI0030FF0C9E